MDSVVAVPRRRGPASRRGYPKKLIISISLYLISFIYFNHSEWEAPMFPHEWHLLKRAEFGSLFFPAGTGAQTSTLLYLMSAPEFKRLELISDELRALLISESCK